MDNQFGYQNNSYQPPVNSLMSEQAAKRAKTSMILGICGVVVFCCTCGCCGIGSIVCSIIAVVLAVLAKRDNDGIFPGKATAGLVLGIIGIVFAAIFGVYALINAITNLNNPNFWEEYQKMMEEYMKQINQAPGMILSRLSGWL